MLLSRVQFLSVGAALIDPAATLRYRMIQQFALSASSVVQRTE
jgi:hypothetical protein